MAPLDGHGSLALVWHSLDMRGSIRDVFIGWGRGMDWRKKVTVQNRGRALVKSKNQPGGVVLAPENKAQSTVWMFGLLKEAATLDIASPETCQCLKLPFELLWYSSKLW